MLTWLRRFLGRKILRYLDHPTGTYEPFSSVTLELFQQYLQPGDVVLVDGNSRLAAIIRYLTQSTWVHSALYIGDALGPSADGEARVLVEAIAELGVIAVPLSKYAHSNKRICRPVSLREEDRHKVVDFAVKSLGKQYDIRHIIDLARYLIPYVPVPVSVRRRMLAFGSGDPTRAICSTLIANAFHAVHYPILPDVHSVTKADRRKQYEISSYVHREILHIRSVGLFTPRDFDVSPYFSNIKPLIEAGFDYQTIIWPEKQNR